MSFIFNTVCRYFQHICFPMFVQLQCFCAVIFFLVFVFSVQTGDIKWWYFWAVSDGQACVNDKDRIVSLLPPFSYFPPLDSESLSCWWSCTHTLWGPQKGGIYNWEEVQRQMSGSYSHCTFPPFLLPPLVYSASLSHWLWGEGTLETALNLNTLKEQRNSSSAALLAFTYHPAYHHLWYWSPKMMALILGLNS